MNAEHEKENKFLLKKKETLEESLELLQKTGHQAIKNNEAADHAVKTQRINADLAEHSVREQALKLKQMREEQKETGVRDEAALATQQDIVDKAREHADALAASAENAEIGNKAGKELASTMLGINKNWKNSWWGQLAGGGFTEKLTALGASFAQAINPADMLGSTLMKIQ